MAIRDGTQMGEVDIAVIGNVSVRRHVLDREASRLAGITQRIGRRLQAWLRNMPEEVPCMREVGKDERGKPVFQQIVSADGKPLMEPFLPDEGFRSNYRWYQLTVLGLLAEQRQRAGMKIGKPPLTDTELEELIMRDVREVIAKMPEAELQRLLEERKK